MNKDYGYNWTRLKTLLCVLPIIAVILYWQRIPINGFTIAVCVCAVGWTAFISMAPTCRIKLYDHGIDIHFLLPLHRHGYFRYSELKGYSPIVFKRKGKDIYLGGFLSPHEGKQIMILPTGVSNFDELNSELMSLLPKPENT